jgi:hypothetical protein
VLIGYYKEELEEYPWLLRKVFKEFNPDIEVEIVMRGRKVIKTEV